MIEVLVGALIALVGSLMSQLIVRSNTRSQWLLEKRQSAYFDFFDAWEDAKKMIVAGSEDSDIDNAFQTIYRSARAIDLLCVASTRSAAWSAVEKLQTYRSGQNSDEYLTNEINDCLNAFKLDLGVPPSQHI